MTLARRHLAGAAVAGAPGQATPGAGVIIDPANPDRPGYRWSAQGGPSALAMFALGGGGNLERLASGGITAIPDPEIAAIRISAWWSLSPYLRIARISPDGSRTPVRFAQKVATLPTRRNRSWNPSFEKDTAGWLAGANSTITRIASETAAAGSYVGRLKATAAGAISTTVPVVLSTDQRTGISLALQPSAATGGALTITAAWQDAYGTTLTPSSATLSAGVLAQFVAAMARTPVLVLNPPTGAVGGSLTLSVAGMAANAYVDLDAALVEDGDNALVGTYFDGDVFTGSWTGAAHATTSTLAAARTVVDAEAPLDVPVRYELTAPDQPGYRAVTEPVVLSSRRRLWLSHPELDLPLQVLVEREPDQTFPIEQAKLRVIGRVRAVVISAARRGAAEGTYLIATARFSDRDRLLTMLQDGSPLLLRMPADHGHGPGEWISIADVGMTVTGHMAREGTRHFSLPYTIVDPPALVDQVA